MKSELFRERVLRVCSGDRKVCIHLAHHSSTAQHFPIEMPEKKRTVKHKNYNEIIFVATTSVAHSCRPLSAPSTNSN